MQGSSRNDPLPRAGRAVRVTHDGAMVETHLRRATVGCGIDLDTTGDVESVTASGSGLGKASATALAREGATVVINGQSIAIDGGSGRSNL